MKIKPNEFRYFILNKPVGYVCALKDNLSPTITELINEKVKGLHIVGRLDKDTTGLIVLTNDGIYTHTHTHPKKNVMKIYQVTLKTALAQKDVIKLESGLVIDHGLTKLKPAKVKIINPHLINLTIYEGKFHQVKKMFFVLNNQVVKLHRIQVGNLKLSDFCLKIGEYKEFKI